MTGTEFSKKNILNSCFFILMTTMFLCCEWLPINRETSRTTDVQAKEICQASVGNENGTARYDNLLPLGDYSKLKFTVRSNKKKYSRGEPVFLRFYVKNLSNSDVHVDERASAFAYAHLWKLVNSKKENVDYTNYGKRIFIESLSDIESQWVKPSSGIGHSGVKLSPGQEIALNFEQVLLNEYFDLTLPDTYELTCFQKDFIMYQKQYAPPLSSNILNFTILDFPRFNPLIYHEGTFDNPPTEEKNGSTRK